MGARAREQRRPTVAILSWRDTRHPEGGGSELYVEQVASGLAALGWDVCLHTADHGAAPRDDVVRGVRSRRRGGHWTVFARAGSALRVFAPDVVVEVQNGMPFLARLRWRAPVVVLVHHVHREQWRVVLPAPLARLGWFLESRVAPRVNGASHYVAVSRTTRDELVELGVEPARLTVLHNGGPEMVDRATPRSPEPSLAVVGRLVPHKRVELALDTLAALVPSHPGVHLSVVGDGYWHDALVRHAEELGVSDRVAFLGRVDDAERDAVLAQSWVHLCPSLKEGWGLAVIEAAAHGTPTVAFRQAGGVRESVVDGRTGYLVKDPEAMAARADELLRDETLRRSMGAAAREHAGAHTWSQTVLGFDELLRGQLAARGPEPVVQRLP